MNKEYTCIAEDEFIVTDENGNTVKRSIDSKNIHKLLLLENKLEQVNDVINNAQKKIDLLSYEPSIKRRLLFYFFPLIITLSGAGVTWQFCRYIDKLLNINNAEKYRDLVALGLDADMMSLRSI